MAIRIGIAGVTGRMGHLLVEEVRAAGADLVGGIGRPGSDKTAPAGVAASHDIEALAAASDVVIDFTNAATARPYAAAIATAGKAWVLGTSGLSEADEAAVATAAERIPVVYASNFSAGVNLVLALCERMGAALPADAYDAEIVEMHHRQKVDAPSGTAVGMGRAVAKGRGRKLEDVMVSGRHGHTGGRETGAIAVRQWRAHERGTIPRQYRAPPASTPQPRRGGLEGGRLPRAALRVLQPTGLDAESGQACSDDRQSGRSGPHHRNLPAAEHRRAGLLAGCR